MSGLSVPFTKEHGLMNEELVNVFFTKRNVIRVSVITLLKTVAIVKKIYPHNFILM